MHPPPLWLGVLNTIAILAIALWLRDLIKHRQDRDWHSLLMTIALMIFLANLFWR